MRWQQAIFVAPVAGTQEIQSAHFLIAIAICPNKRRTLSLGPCITGGGMSLNPATS